jgi:hypothetical protein
MTEHFSSLVSDDREIDGEEGLVSFLFIPELVAIAVFEMVCQETGEEIDSAMTIAKVPRSNVVRYVLESRGSLERYTGVVKRLIGFGEHRSYAPSEMCSAFRVDTASCLRSLMLMHLTPVAEADKITTTPRFRAGMKMVEAVIAVIPPIGFRRCPSCHVAGEGSRNFRHVRIRDAWGFGELCIYCSPRDWYGESKGIS